MHTLVDPLERAQRVAPSRTALVCGDVRESYAELWTRCRNLAGALGASGVGAGERVAIWAANSHQYVEVYAGVPAAGRVVVPLNTRHAEPELLYALEDSGARVLFTDREPGKLADVVERVIRIPDEYEQWIGAAEEAELGVGIDVGNDRLERAQVGVGGVQVLGGFGHVREPSPGGAR